MSLKVCNSITVHIIWKFSHLKYCYCVLYCIIQYNNPEGLHAHSIHKNMVNCSALYLIRNKWLWPRPLHCSFPSSSSLSRILFPKHIISVPSVLLLMALFHCMVRHGTVQYGSILGGFPLGTVPGTFLVPPRPRFQASRTVTKTWRVNSAGHWLAGENRHCLRHWTCGTNPLDLNQHSQRRIERSCFEWAHLSFNNQKMAVFSAISVYTWINVCYLSSYWDAWRNYTVILCVLNENVVKPVQNEGIFVDLLRCLQKTLSKLERVKSFENWINGLVNWARLISYSVLAKTVI